MTANELRIGNYLQGRSSFVQVTRIYSEHAVGISKGDPYYVSGDRPCLTPIHLTEEWLVKFGVNKLHKNIKVSYWNDDFLNEQMTLRINETLIKIKYVHQLQNLIFALTGEELTLKQ
jgi:hypothetical protein